MKIKVCENVCSTCPWRAKNAHQLLEDVIYNMLRQGTISPCHQDLAKYTGSPYFGVEEYQHIAPEFKVCRGLTNAHIMSDADMSKYPIGMQSVWLKLYDEFQETGGANGEALADINEIMKKVMK